MLCVYCSVHTHAGHEAVFPASVMKNKDTLSTAQRFIQVFFIYMYNAHACTCMHTCIVHVHI